MPEIADVRKNNGPTVELDTVVKKSVWEEDDAPDGSTSESLLVYEGGVPVRVSGPTHYHGLANGEIVGGYGIGTHHSTPDGVVPILTITGA